MDGVRGYLIRLTAAAIVCGIVTGVLGKKGTLGAVIQLLAGVFMVITIVSPWTKIRLNGFGEYFDSLSLEAASAAADGENTARETLADIIKSETEAYILDKADSFGATLTVEVILDDAAVPAPCGVRISGSISPYGKSELSRIIEEDLAIALEDQIWTG